MACMILYYIICMILYYMYDMYYKYDMYDIILYDVIMLLIEFTRHFSNTYYIFVINITIVIVFDMPPGDLIGNEYLDYKLH